MNIQVECRDKTLTIQAGEMTLTIVSPHSLASSGIEDGSPAEILSWVGMTFFAQRPATITLLSSDGKPCGIRRLDCARSIAVAIPQGKPCGISSQSEHKLLTGVFHRARHSDNCPFPQTTVRAQLATTDRPLRPNTVAGAVKAGSTPAPVTCNTPSRDGHNVVKFRHIMAP